MTMDSSRNSTTQFASTNGFRSLRISAHPERVTEPCMVTFTAYIEAGNELQGITNPSGLALKWEAGDESSEKYFRGAVPTITNAGDPSSFQYILQITRTDLEYNRYGHVTVVLHIGDDTPSLSLAHTVYLDADKTVPCLPPPRCAIPSHADTGMILIDDGVLAGFSQSMGIPFRIPKPLQPPTDGSGIVTLWGHTQAGPLTPRAMGDIPLFQQRVGMSDIEQDISSYIPVDHPIFAENRNVNIYYTQNFSHATVSDDLRIAISRDSLKVPSPHPGIPAPIPGLTVYTQHEHSRYTPLNAVVYLPASALPQAPCAGDKVHLCLQLLGAVPGSVNATRTWTLSHTLERNVQVQGDGRAFVKFDGVEGNPAGFSHTCFDDLNLSDAELYFLYERAGSVSILRSASSWIHVDTVSPVSEDLHKALTLAVERRRAARVGK